MVKITKKQLEEQRERLWGIKYAKEYLSIFPKRHRCIVEEQSKHLGGNDIFKSIFLSGDVGTGKTTMCCILMFAYMRTSFIKQKAYKKDFTYVNVTDLLYKIKDSFNSETKSIETETVKQLQSVKYLALDDLGVEKTTDWSHQLLYQVLNHRYEEELPVLATSNFDLSALSERFGGDKRIVSRLREMCTIKDLKGEDRRIKKI